MNNQLIGGNMAKDGMTLVIRADAPVAFKSLREIWGAVNTPGVTVIPDGPDGHVNIKKSQRSKQPKQSKRTSVRPRLELKKEKVAKIPEVEVPIEGDWLKELQSLTAEKKKEGGK